MNVSVIVPVYNVEKYLAECLDSILSQEFDSMEIICVEDGSSDNSLKILEFFSQKYTQIKVIKHNKNRGLAAARNTGLKCATGKYVLFVDSDDLLARNALNVLYKEAEHKNVDVVYFDIMKFYDSILNCEEISKTIWNSFDGIYKGREFFCMTMKNDEYRCEACRQFIRREFLLEHKICFLDSILHEDILFSFCTLMEVQKVSVLRAKLYYYRQRENSITKTKNIKRAQSLFVILGEIFIYWKTHKFTEEESFYIGKRWESLYRTYKLYLAYGDNSMELECGDKVDKEIYKIINSSEKKWLKIADLPLNRIKALENVIVYGAGKAAKQIVEYLREKDVEVKCIMVESMKDNPSKFCGINVYEAGECLKFRDKSVVIIGVTSKRSMGIKDTLRNNGFKNIIQLADNM